MKKFCTILGLWILFILPTTSWALSFAIPPKGDKIVGKVQTVEVKSGDNYTKIGRKFDVGYYELFEANPGVDPDKPQPGTILIIPTQYILPPGLRANTIIINQAEMRLYYESASKHKIYTFPVGIGKEKWNTPTGYFKIIHKIKSPTWFVPKSIYEYRKKNNDKVAKIVPAGPDNPMGDYALRLSDPTYLIHGTDDPAGIGRRSSAGCIRMFPKDIKHLFGLVAAGDKVFIINRPYKATEKNNRTYLEAHMPLSEQRAKMHDNYSAAISLVKKVAKHNRTHLDWQQVKTIAQEHIGIPTPIHFTKHTTKPPKPSHPKITTASINSHRLSWQQKLYKSVG